MRFGLKIQTINKIKEVFASFPSVREVIIYGSCAKGTYRPGSDIDLTVKGEQLTLETMNKISIQLDDLLLPYMIDLSIYEHIKTPQLIEHIRGKGQVIFVNHAANEI